MVTKTKRPQVSLCLLQLHLDRPFSNRAPKANLLRGALSRDFDHPLMHQHIDGRLLYRYPLVQYRWDRSRHGPVLFGVGEGAAHLLTLPLHGHRLTFGEEKRDVVGMDAEIRQASIVEGEGLYCFATPWLPFKDSGEFEQQSQGELEEVLGRRFVSNTLIAARGLGIEIDWQLEASVRIKEVVRPTHKRIQRMGIFAEVEINAELPEHLGLGVAPSHGFGWLRRAKSRL